MGLATLRSLNLVSYGGRSHHCLDNHSFGCAPPAASSFLNGTTPAPSACGMRADRTAPGGFVQLSLQSPCRVLHWASANQFARRHVLQGLFGAEQPAAAAHRHREARDGRRLCRGAGEHAHLWLVPHCCHVSPAVHLLQ